MELAPVIPLFPNRGTTDDEDDFYGADVYRRIEHLAGNVHAIVTDIREGNEYPDGVA